MAAKAIIKIATVAVALAGAMGVSDAFARSSDRNQPVDISSDYADYQQQDGKPTTISGNVVITQGTLVINATKGTVYLQNGEVVRVVLTGGPVRLRQSQDNGDPLTVNATNLDYNLRTDVIVLNGNVRISQPSGNLAAPTATYNMGTGRFESQAGSGGRVKMRFVPKSQRT